MAVKVKGLFEIVDDTQVPQAKHNGSQWINDDEESINFGNQILEDLKKVDLNGFNFYTYQAEVRARGNQPYLMKDILKIENSQAKTCKSCSFFRGEFGDKYLCKKPSSDDFLNNCFVNKKELDDLDFCIDYKYDYNRAEKSSKKTFCFNQPFKDIWN